MNAMTAQELRDDYLRRLDAAITDIPHGLAVELRAGIAEELRGTDQQALESRIRELGTPEDVAQAAIEAGFGTPSHSAAPAPALSATSASLTPAVAAQIPLTETRGFAITSAIVLGFGGFIVPFFGWIAGAVMVTNSRLWSRREKAWAIGFPPLAATASMLFWFLAGLATAPASAALYSENGFHAPNEADFNPLVPTLFDVIWSSLLVSIVVAPFTAVWLLLRLRGNRGVQKTRS